MARPRKQPHEKRSEQNNLRFTVAEMEHIRTQAAAAGLDVPDYLRARSLNYVVPSGGSVRRSDPALVTEINRLGVELKALGNNANQLARAVHTDRHFHGRWEEIADAIADTKRRVSDALSRIVST